MSTMLAERTAIARQPIWLVKVWLDQCTLTRGILPCTALVNCYYTWTTCKDNLGTLNWRTNYVKGSYAWTFCNRGATVSGALPYLETPISFIPTRIDQKNFKTEREEITLKFSATWRVPWRT